MRAGKGWFDFWSWNPWPHFIPTHLRVLNLANYSGQNGGRIICTYAAITFMSDSWGLRIYDWFIRSLLCSLTSAAARCGVFKLLVKSVLKWSLRLSRLLSWFDRNSRSRFLSQVISNVTGMLEILFGNVYLDIRVNIRFRKQLLIFFLKIVSEVPVKNGFTIAALCVTLGSCSIEFTFCDITSSQWNSIYGELFRLVSLVSERGHKFLAIPQNMILVRLKYRKGALEVIWASKYGSLCVFLWGTYAKIFFNNARLCTLTTCCDLSQLISHKNFCDVCFTPY